VKKSQIGYRGFSAIRLSAFATALMMLLLAGGVCPQTASAQTDTALLASLTPYHVTQAGYKTATCTTYGYCTMAFPAVPAGKRLLVTNVSLNTFNQTNTLGAVLTNGLTISDTNYHQINLPGAVIDKNTPSGFGYVFSYSGVTTFYLDAGEKPTFVYYGSVLTNDFAGFASITGVIVPK
jgi:hypothetical protein